MPNDLLTPDDFNELADHALSRRPDKDRVILSAAEIQEHNADLDAYMVENFPEDWIRDAVALEQQEYVFAATGRVFLRTVKDLDGAMATPATPDGAVYMVTNEETSAEMMNEACWVIDTFRLH